MNIYGHKTELQTQKVTMHTTSPPITITSNNDYWSYEGTTLSVVVNLFGYATNKPVSVNITFSDSVQDPLLTSGFSRKLFLLQKAKDVLDEEWGLSFFNFVMINAAIFINAGSCVILKTTPVC